MYVHKRNLILMFLHICRNCETALISCLFVLTISMCGIGRFSEAGLHEWMPFVIFRARSRERSQRHFRADFWVGVASRCVQQWKLNLELRSNTNANTVAVAKITGEREWRVGKKVSLRRFLADQKIESSWKKMRFGASYGTSNKLLLVARHILTTGLQKCI